MSEQPAQVHDAREQRFGRFYEELVPGHRFRHWPGKTVNASEAHLFCLLTMSASPLHIDDHYAREEMDGGQSIVLGTYVYALVAGMTVPDVSGKAVANLGVEHLRHVAPVHHGDTLYAYTDVLRRRLSESRPGVGIVTVATTGHDAGDRVVIEYERSFMVPCQPSGAAA